MVTINGQSVPDTLYIKNLGSGEQGLGFTHEVTHEISNAYVLDLDMSNLVSQGITSGQVKIESIQSGEGFRLCVGDTVGTLDTDATCVMGTGAGGLTQTTPILSFNSQDHIIAITGFEPPGSTNPNADV